MEKEIFKKLFLECITEDTEFRDSVLYELSRSRNFYNYVGEAYKDYQDACDREEASAWT